MAARPPFPVFLPLNRVQAAWSAFYAAKFTLLGVQLPFFSGWLALKGFTVAEIGWLTGAALIARLVFGPVYAFWADRRPDPRLPLRVASLLFAVGAVFLLAPAPKAGIAAASILVFWSFGLLVPLADTAVLQADRRGELRYGPTRAVGSFAFLVTTVLAGAALAQGGLGLAAPVMAAAAAATFLIALALPRGPAAGGGRLSLPAAASLLSRPAFAVFLLAAALVQGGHAAYYAFSILHWQGLGLSTGLIGWLWATGVLAEIVLLARVRPLIRRAPPLLLIALGGMAAAFRWTLTAAEPPVPLLFALQTLHALTFAATYVGAIEHVDRVVPKALANTAMTLMSATGVGAATGLATMAAGELYARAGASGAYGLMAAMGAVGGAMALALHWRAGRAPGADGALRP